MFRLGVKFKFVLVREECPVMSSKLMKTRLCVCFITIINTPISGPC